MSYTVENITEKTVNTKFGPKKAFSIKANGEWYGYGFKKPAFSIGDEVDFQFSETAYGKQVDDKSVRTLSKAGGTSSPTSSAPAPAKAYGAPAKVFPIPPLHGDRAIVRQNSITNATKMVTELLVANKEKMGMSETADLIVNIARKFEEYSCGDIEAIAAEQMATPE
jgi:hypothetical protein